MRFIVSYLLLSIMFVACKQETRNTSTDTDYSDVFNEIVEKRELRYVVSPAGVLLRDSASIDAEPVTILRYGLEVVVENDPSAETIEINGLIGKMLPTTIEQQTGYAFSAFLSKYPSPDPQESLKSYYERIKPLFPAVSFTEEGKSGNLMSSTIHLPEANWASVFYYSKRMFGFTDVFNLPAVSGPNNPPAVTNEAGENMATARKDGNLTAIELSRPVNDGQLIVILKQNKDTFSLTSNRTSQ